MHKCNFKLFRDRIRIRIRSRVSVSIEGSYAQLRLRAASEVTSKFEFETSREWISMRIVSFESSKKIPAHLVCPAAAAAVQIHRTAVGGIGSGRKTQNRIQTLCGPWKRNVDGKTAGREALRRSGERRSAKGGRSRRRRCSPSTTSASRPLTRRP